MTLGKMNYRGKPMSKIEEDYEKTINDKVYKNKYER